MSAGDTTSWLTTHRQKIDVGIVLAVVGLFVAVLAVNPKDWRHNIGTWTSDTAHHWLVILLCLGSFCLGGAVWRKVFPSGSDASAEVIGAEAFEERFSKSMALDVVRVIKVFGYTQETMSDYLRFDHRKRPIEMRVLNRSWLAEEVDEATYNAANAKQGLRMWNKSQAIRSNATRQLPPGALRRVIRYYDRPPCIKAILLCGDTILEGFVSFYEWQNPPSDGGSPFKGADLSMIHLRQDSQEAADVLHYLDSQFELAWYTAATADVLRGRS